MKSLKEIKDEVAREYGYHEYYEGFMVDDAFMNSVSKAYAEQALREAAEEAKIKDDSGDPSVGRMITALYRQRLISVDKESILSLIPKLK